jgi:hypothetical protein
LNYIITYINKYQLFINGNTTSTNQNTRTQALQYLNPWNLAAINAIIFAEKSDASITQYNTNMAANNTTAANQNLTDAQNFAASGNNLLPDAINPDKVIASIQQGMADLAYRAQNVINTTNPMSQQNNMANVVLMNINGIAANLNKYQQFQGQFLFYANSILINEYIRINNAENKFNATLFTPPLKTLMPTVPVPNLVDVMGLGGGNRIMYGGKSIHKCGPSCAIHRYYVQKILS